jgi:hypothetical protein
MIVFNTTYLVSDKVYADWLIWVKEEHIPFMLQFKPFHDPQVAKVLTNEQQDGFSVSVQFCILDMETLNIWNEKYGQAFLNHCTQKFGTEVVFFSTLLQLI